MSVLPVAFAVDLRKLVFSSNLSVHVMSTVNIMFLSLLWKSVDFYVKSIVLQMDSLENVMYILLSLSLCLPICTSLHIAVWVETSVTLYVQQCLRICEA